MFKLRKNIYWEDLSRLRKMWRWMMKLNIGRAPIKQSKTWCELVSSSVETI